MVHKRSDYLHGMVCTISGTTVTAGTDTQLSAAFNSYNGASAALINTNKIIVPYNGKGTYLYGVVLDLLDGAYAIEALFGIDGLTKTACTTSTAGQVWVLDNS